jgi:hypothetical protein
MVTRYEKETVFTGLERIRTFDAIVMTDANRGWKHEGKKGQERKEVSVCKLCRMTFEIPTPNPEESSAQAPWPRIQGASCRQEK